MDSICPFGFGAPEEVSWAARELEHLSGCEPRLMRRLVTTLEDWGNKPSASIPAASRTRAAAKGTYRLLSNARVRAVDVEESHREATGRRMSGHEVVLAVADTTSINLSGREQTEGLGPIGSGRGCMQGFLLHALVAMSEEGEMLGVLHTQVWAREKQGRSRREKRAQRNTRPLQERESQRWNAGYEAIVEQSRQRAQSGETLPRIVYVADRESDIYELFVSNRSGDAYCGVLVRALHARRLHPSGQIVWEALEQEPVLGSVELEVPARGGKPARRAVMELRSAAVTLGVPRDKAKLFAATEVLELWAIEAREVDPPEGVEGLHWKLLSSIPCADFASANRQVGWYARRWGIEVFFRTLKSGCRFEDRRLGTLERMQRALSLDLIVAWRVLALRDAARRHPEASALDYLEPEECEVLRAWATRQSPDQTPPPTIARAVEWIARLGGWLARKKDPPPGAEVIWKGLHSLHDMTQTWKLAKLVGKS